MEKSFSIINLILLFFLFCGCEKPLEKDETNPEVLSFLVNAMNSEVTIAKGGVLNISAQFSDNEMLQKYRIKIVDKFYGKIVGEPFSFEKVGPVNGKSGIANINVVVPDTTLSGYFDIVAEVMDEEGNISIPTTISLHIDQNIKPQITVDIGKVNFFAGDTLPLTGFVKIPTDLDVVYFDIVENQLFGEKIQEEVFVLTDEIVTTWSLGELTIQNRPLVVPGNAKRGNYLVHVAAYDSVGNMSLNKLEIKVEERLEN